MGAGLQLRLDLAPVNPLMATPPSDVRSRWVALVTGALSILIAVVYLLLVTWLDRQGPLLPPPPEALGLAAAPAVAAAVPDGVARVPPRG